jgi:hypothetical protein
MNPTIVLYTHTDYKDVWPVIFGQTNKYLPLNKKIIFVDKFDESIDSSYTQIYYDDKLSYTDRVRSCLEKVTDDLILFFHEDMPLYADPDNEILNQFTSLVKEGKADFIRLIKAGVDEMFIPSGIHSDLVECPENSLFSIQPTITTTKKLKDIFSDFPNLNIWQFESNVSDSCIRRQYTKCYMASKEFETKRGLYHWNSDIFPYVATAIVKGRWNCAEYNLELNELFERYNIDKNKRGVIFYV